jgi:anti-sigma factor RsiW
MTEMNGHAEFDQLLLLVDASAPTRATRSVRRHVATCWRCRTRLEELQETVREFARYHEKVVLPNLPAAPQAWPDLRRRMQEADESSQMFGLWTRVSSYFSLPAPLARRLLLGVLVTGCCVLAFAIAARKKAAESPTVKPGALVVREVLPAPVPEHTSRNAPASPKLVTPSTVDSEVRVFRALHEIEADLGDPVEVSRTASGEIKVVGNGVSAARQQEIRGAIGAIPNVITEWHEAPIRPESRLRSAKAVNLEGARNPFEVMLRPAAPDWESFSNRVLDESDAILARAHALRTLEEHFPEERRAKLAPEDQNTLDQISAAHFMSFGDHVRTLGGILAPMFASRPEPSQTHPDFLAAAQRMDRVVSIIFGGAATTEKPSQVLADLSQAVADLNAAVEAKR